MKLLADAHVGWLIIRYLESRGHDVLRAATLPPGMLDAEILRLAVEQERVIVTSDKDFGELIFRMKIPSAGVVLLRINVRSEDERLTVFSRLWPTLEPLVLNHFTTITNKRGRRTRITL